MSNFYESFLFVQSISFLRYITTTHSSRPYNLKEQEQSQTMVAEDMDRQ